MKKLEFLKEVGELTIHLAVAKFFYALKIGVAWCF